MSESTLEKVKELAAAVEAERPCWRCQASRRPPSLDEQIAILKVEHARRSPVFWFSDSEWLQLRSLLKKDDVLAVAANVFRIANPFYDGVWVLRGDQQIIIPRKALK
jgi:hypothetical protein